MQDFSKRIGLVASLHQVTGYSSSVNGKKIMLRRKRNLGFTAMKKPFFATKRFTTTKLLLAAAKRKLDEKTILGFATTKKPFAATKRSVTVKLLLTMAKRKLDEKPIPGFVVAKKPFVVAKRFCTAKTLSQRRKNICLYPSFKSNQTS